MAIMIRTNDYSIRANEAFASAVIAWDKGDINEYDRNRKILIEMVRDHCISNEYIRDLDGYIKNH